jgi:S-formylglutathione hydrolase FrmB
MSFRRVAITGAAALLLASVAAAVAFGHGSSRSDDRALRAHAAALRYAVWLPPDYDTSGLRYPVVYFLHGLPGNAATYRSIGWLERALDATGVPAILVAPQGATSRDRDPEYLGRWETSIAVDLPRAVDRAYRTIRTRSGRALIGLSAGGYGAMHIAIAHLREYAVVESWSGYFHPTDPTGSYALDLGSPSRNAAANVHRQLAQLEAELDREPLYLAFYIGRGDPTGSFVAENEQLNRELTAARIPHVFRLYSGGHTQTLWAREAPAWLRLALNHLAPAR